MCVIDPLVPMIPKTYTPLRAVESTDTVKVEVTWPLAGGLTGFGLKEYVMPVGAAGSIQLPDKATSELKPLIEVKHIEEASETVPEDGLTRRSTLGFDRIVKSLVAGETKGPE